MRPPNEVDFWRGFALVTIFINHVPGIIYEHFTYRNVSSSDSAELFVFLAGWAVYTVVERMTPPYTTLRIVLRLGARGIVIYCAQLVISMLALAMIASAAYFMNALPLLGWHNAAAVFEDPVPAHIGLVLMSHQLGYFDILPLYVVLMLTAPAIALIDRLAPRLLLPLSLALYVVTLVSEYNVPTWPVEGHWFLDPFAWQLVFVLGFLAGRPNGVAALVRRHLRWIRPVTIIIVLIGAYMTFFEVRIDPFKVPSPRLFFVFDTTYLSPPRLIHFVALVITFAGSFVLIRRYLAWPSRYCCLLGRNGLNVFCVGSLLSLAGQIARFMLGGNIVVDTVVLCVGLVVLGATAWVSEWRDRLRQLPASQPAQ
jgi:hypothetical protein